MFQNLLVCILWNRELVISDWRQVKVPWEGSARANVLSEIPFWCRLEPFWLEFNLSFSRENSKVLKTALVGEKGCKTPNDNSWVLRQGNRKLHQHQPPSPSVPQEPACAEMSLKCDLWWNFTLGKGIDQIFAVTREPPCSCWDSCRSHSSWKLLVAELHPLCAQPGKSSLQEQSSAPEQSCCEFRMCWKDVVAFCLSFLQPFSPGAQPSQRAKVLELIGFLKLLISSLPASSVCVHSPGLI